jgi:hypothetical protein
MQEIGFGDDELIMCSKEYKTSDENINIFE